MNNGNRGREGSMGSLIMAAIYLALMASCLVFGLRSQQDIASKECERHNNDCRTLDVAARSR